MSQEARRKRNGMLVTVLVRRNPKSERQSGGQFYC